jgi:hypothetical protein
MAQQFFNGQDQNQDLMDTFIYGTNALNLIRDTLKAYLSDPDRRQFGYTINGIEMMVAQMEATSTNRDVIFVKTNRGNTIHIYYVITSDGEEYCVSVDLHNNRGAGVS